MATTQTLMTVDRIKGAYQGASFHLYRGVVLLGGTYLTGAKPSIDLFSAVPGGMGKISGSCTAIAVKWARVFGDLADASGNVYTAPNANIVLSNSGSSTNNVLTFRVDATDATHSNGDTNTEVGDGTALNGYIGFLFGTTVSNGSSLV